MSINVTVNGNPISIKRGRMVTADPTAAKKEFDKRRKIRLEQVRQQSKEIAENVRNRVRNEKSKQLSTVEKKGEHKLKEWQTRKLLELQNQYQESLKDIGLAHQQAQLFNKLEEQMASRKEEDLAKARERGEVAAQKLQAEKNERSLKKAAPIQQKKFARDVENIRSNIITNLRKKKSPFKRKKTRKKVVTDINISSVVQDSGSSKSSEVSDDEGNASDQSESLKSGSVKEQSEVNSPSDFSEIKENATDAKAKRSTTNLPSDNENPMPKCSAGCTNASTSHFPLETRISQRIKCRTIPVPSLPLYNTEAVNSEIPVQKHVIHSDPSIAKYSTTCKHSHPELYTNTEQRSKSHKSSSHHTAQEIPSRPTVSIKESTQRLVTTTRSSKKQSGARKVQSYDHRTRSTKNSVPAAVHIERVPEHVIEIVPDSGGEAEFRRNVKEYDRLAQIRGRKALEREKINKEYNDLLKQLPVLQRQEHLYGKKIDKPEYHMTDERLKDRQEQRQLRIQNAYEEIMLRPQEVRLPQRNDVPCKAPFRVVDLTNTNTNEGSHTINVGAWSFGDAQEKKVDDSPVDPKASEDERRKGSELRALLERLRVQQRILMEESKDLPQNSNLDSVLSNLSANEMLEMLRLQRLKPKVARKKSRTPPNTSEESSSSSLAMKLDAKRQKSKQHHKKCCLQPDSVETSPSKRPRIRTVILQNTSTQTTPKQSDSKQTETEKIETSFVKNQTEAPLNKCDKATSPVCACKFPPGVRATQSEYYHVCKKPQMDDKLCEIVIKIRENQTAPEISIKPQQEALKDTKLPKDGKSSPKEEAKKPKPTKTSDKKSTWREQLSQNSDHYTSTSTSYFSPPDPQRAKAQIQTTLETETSGSKPSDRVLGSKPQQSNFVSGSEASSVSNEGVAKYVKKLLAMSRGSVDNLQVSTVSEVSTPSQSVIETAQNKPDKFLLKHILDSLNITKSELRQYINQTSVPPNSVDSLNYFTDTESTTLTTTNNSSSGTVDKLQKSSRNVQEEYSRRNFPKMTSKYEEIADTCNKRINSLTAMIEKVRLEKDKILQKSSDTTPSDKENSTAYLELPHKSDPSDTSGSPNDLSRKILEIDENLVENLKTMSDSQIEKQYADVLLRQKQIPEHEEDDEIVKRFKKLLSSGTNTELPRSSATNTDAPVNTAAQADFVPLLLDIPKLPKFTATALQVEHKSKRPPPAKGLLVAKKFNGDITAVPHELSTIVETDSVVSTRLQKSVSSERLRLSSGSEKGRSRSISPRERINESPSAGSSGSKKSSDTSLPDILPESIKTAESSERRAEDREKAKSPSKKLTKIASSDSSSEFENMEMLLKEMGMGWAIATLRKTQEALALTSSSSSLDLSLKQREGEKAATDNSSISDLSLRELINRLKVSMSTNESSMSSYMKDIQDISSIMGSSGKAKESRAQRTSTPVVKDNRSDQSGGNSLPKGSSKDGEMSGKSHSSEKDNVQYYSLHSDESA